ncbi:hypothetical protein [Nocardioides pacificus]
MDHAVLEMLRLVSTDDWSAEIAAARLRDLADGDERVLRHLRARVARALLQRPTSVGVRAHAALDLALRS